MFFHSHWWCVLCWCAIWCRLEIFYNENTFFLNCKNAEVIKDALYRLILLILKIKRILVKYSIHHLHISAWFLSRVTLFIHEEEDYLWSSQKVYDVLQIIQQKAIWWFEIHIQAAATYSSSFSLFFYFFFFITFIFLFPSVQQLSQNVKVKWCAESWNTI